MATQEMQLSQDYAQAAAVVMSAMPPEQAEQAHDFARFYRPAGERDATQPR